MKPASKDGKDPGPPKPKVLNIAEKRPEKIRVELNVEKWPALWRPARSQADPKVRLLEREFTTSTGIRGISKLEIGFTHLGTVTTEDQRMFYALIRLWEESGKPADRPVFFSDRQLARLLHKKWGTNVIESINASLRRLRTTPLRWINSYHRNDGSGKSVEEETFFNFLEQLKIVTRKEHGHITNQQGYFKFGNDILNNLLNNYTKPLFDDEFFKLETEIGQLLYTHIDLVMADKTRYERRTKELFADLGLLLPENPSYSRQGNRKQGLQRPAAELIGKRLSTGELKSITFERTADGKDYKIIFIKGKATPIESLPPAAAAIEAPKSQQAIEAEELVVYFHQRFHGVETSEPLSKELDQASALIAKYGAEQARFTIDFAWAMAQETKFHIQHFGAVLNYAPRAIASLERRRQADETVREAMEMQARRMEAEQERQARGEAALAALSPEEYQSRFDQARAGFYQEYPKLASFGKGKQGAKLHEEIIRVRMMRQIEQEQ